MGGGREPGLRHRPQACFLADAAQGPRFPDWERSRENLQRCERRHILDSEPAVILTTGMLPARITKGIIRSLDYCAGWLLRPDSRPKRQKIGRKGEEDAYFHLRRLGYLMVARNWRTPHCHGEIDLIGWDGDVLCFIEVKTRTTQDVKPAEAAVDRHKRQELALVARQYLKRLPPTCQWRIDIVSVYYGGRTSRPSIEVFRNASISTSNKKFAGSH